MVYDHRLSMFAGPVIIHELDMRKPVRLGLLYAKAKNKGISREIASLLQPWQWPQHTCYSNNPVGTDLFT